MYVGPRLVDADEEEEEDELRDELLFDRVKSEFSEFLLRFRVRNSYVYRDKLRQSWALGRLLLEARSLVVFSVS